jgi:hypothetical protein
MEYTGVNKTRFIGKIIESYSLSYMSNQNNDDLFLVDIFNDNTKISSHMFC